MNAQFVVIGRWDDPTSNKLTLQDFIIEGYSYIAVFSDEATFKRQARGTPFEREGVALDLDLLLSILRTDDLVILDPGMAGEKRLTKEQFAVHVGGHGAMPSRA